MPYHHHRRYFGLSKLEESNQWLLGTADHGLKKLAVSCISNVNVCNIIKYAGGTVKENEWLWERVLELGAESLCAACQGGHLDVLQAMFETHEGRGRKKEAARLAKLKKAAGATVKVGTDDKTPFICACEGGFVDCAAFIRQHISNESAMVRWGRAGG